MAVQLTRSSRLLGVDEKYLHSLAKGDEPEGGFSMPALDAEEFLATLLMLIPSLPPICG